MKKIFTKVRLALLMAVVLALGIVAQAFAANAYTPAFTDVKKSDWFYSYVEQVAEKGWIKGYPDGTFGPNNSVTYAEFCTMLVNSFFQDKVASYTGSRDPWYMPYCITAAKAGLMTNTWVHTAGQMNDFWVKDDAATRAISRGEMAIMVHNVLREFGMMNVTQAEIAEAEKRTPDVKKWGVHGFESIWAVKATGVLSGVDEQGNFAPNDPMTRAQAAVVLTKLDEYIKGGGTKNPPSQTVAGKDANGYTLASSVNAVKSKVGKSDDYKTKGRAASPNKNGYFTAANVEIGDAQLMYEFLGMVNEARTAEGLNTLEWANLDSFEEYTLLRAYELTKSWSHVRPGDQYSFLGEIIARGQVGTRQAFNDWMNSPGHRASIMRETNVTMCAARCGNCWIITFGGRYHPAKIENGADVNYVTANGWYDGTDLGIPILEET